MECVAIERSEFNVCPHVNTQTSRTTIVENSVPLFFSHLIRGVFLGCIRQIHALEEPLAPPRLEIYGFKVVEVRALRDRNILTKKENNRKKIKSESFLIF